MAITPESRSSFAIAFLLIGVAILRGNVNLTEVAILIAGALVLYCTPWSRIMSGPIPARWQMTLRGILFVACILGMSFAGLFAQPHSAGDLIGLVLIATAILVMVGSDLVARRGNPKCRSDKGRDDDFVPPPE
jgi:hypothetical protein